MTESTNESTETTGLTDDEKEELAYITDIIVHTVNYSFRQGFEAAALAQEAVVLTTIPEAGKLAYDKVLNNTITTILNSIINGLEDNSEPKDSEGQAEQAQEAGSDAVTDQNNPVN